MILQKQEKPQRPKPQAGSIFAPRQKLNLVYTLKPPTQEQRDILNAERIHVWPGSVEFKNSDSAKQVLTELDVAWSDKK